jgi:hypothetical protein
MSEAIAGGKPMATRAAMVSQAAGLVAWLVFSFGAATSGFFGVSGEWYAGLPKPAWNPPAWVFGPVWSAWRIGWLCEFSSRSRQAAGGPIGNAEL